MSKTTPTTTPGDSPRIRVSLNYGLLSTTTYGNPSVECFYVLSAVKWVSTEHDRSGWSRLALGMEPQLDAVALLPWMPQEACNKLYDAIYGHLGGLANNTSFYTGPTREQGASDEG